MTREEEELYLQTLRLVTCNPEMRPLTQSQYRVLSLACLGTGYRPTRQERAVVEELIRMGFAKWRDRLNYDPTELGRRVWEVG
jgi:hypothetical protein